MKASLRKIIKQFDDYPEEQRNFIIDVILLEDEKLSVDHPQMIEKMNQLLEKVLKSENKQD